ncbi:MAG TPA: Cof-type HAD-IIB family hydrolase [Stellaceae bacterium]|nr:Cof-type HAD-IIB family hydrolase [Stellaceae bacterium]
MDRIALVISDVDGTLVTTQKRLTERTRQAVAALHARGIGFTLVSSRPVFGLRMLVESLGLRLPLAAFNGGAIATPELAVLKHRALDRNVAGEIVAFLRARELGVWLFTTTAWLTSDPAGAHVEHETMTVQQPPTVVANFDAVADRAIKIVGVSDDFARLQAIEADAQPFFAAKATAARSQSYYLDFVAPGIDKGFAVRELTDAIGIPLSETVTLGDMENDTPMFRQSAFSIAMGNASDAVKAEAHETTLSNDEDGFAAAIERFVLPRAGAA